MCLVCCLKWILSRFLFFDQNNSVWTLGIILFCLDFDRNSDKNERRQFHGGIKLLSIENVAKREGKREANLEFVIAARDHNKNAKPREYYFKCASENMRDTWVDGLKQYVTYIRQMQDMIAQQ